MDNETFVERLAERYYSLSVNRRVAYLEWSQLAEWQQERERDRVRRHFLPIIQEYIDGIEADQAPGHA